MSDEKYINKIDKSLHNLEQKGEIVITSTIPQLVSKTLYYSVFEEILANRDKIDALMECDIPFLLEQIAENIIAIFRLDPEQSKSIVNEYYKRLLQRLNMREIAAIIYHETPFEMALLSYYCVELKNGDSRDFEYIEWRKSYYAQNN